MNGHFFSDLNENKLIDLLIYGNKFGDKKKRSTLMSIIKFVKGSQRFDEQTLE